MKQEYFFSELLRKISELEQHISDNKDTAISKIEIDLALERIRKIYEEILSFGFDKETKAYNKVSQTRTDKASDQTLYSRIEDEIQESARDTKEIASEEILSSHKKSNSSAKEEKPIKVTIDLFSDSTLNKGTVFSKINDPALSSEQEETVADKIQKNKVSSIKEAIGINEKFFFINELFGGILNDYNQAIHDLDHANSKNDASTRLAKQADHYQWDKKSEAFQQLKKFVDRKYKF